MTALCLIDTTIFVELLNIPRKAQQHLAITRQLHEKIHASESMFLPMITIIETGNHIGQIADGNYRRQRAEHFVAQVKLAIDGKSPFQPINFLEANDLRLWLVEFVEWVKPFRRGLGDLSIKHDWDRLRKQNKGRRVYIWSLDEHLSSFDTNG
jgi:hypothetical protein